MNDAETAERLSDYRRQIADLREGGGHPLNRRKCRTALSRRVREAFNCRRCSAAGGILS